MPQKLLKPEKAEIAPKQEADSEMNVVLVGTYKEKQLAWVNQYGVYNYPVKDGDELTDEMCLKIKELWLYADAKSMRHTFVAEFVGKMSQEKFLALYPSYAKLGKPKNKAYYVFKTISLDYSSRYEGQIVIARTEDFGRRSAKIKKKIEQYKADGEFAPLGAYLPSDLAKVPCHQLLVYETAVQMDFFASMFKDVHEGLEQLVFEHPCNKNALTHVDCFAGPGGICTGLHAAGFDTKVAIEYIRSCVDTYSTNHPSVHVIHSDIRKVSEDQVLPYIPNGSVDLVTSGMPCETFSTAGNTSRSFYDDRQFLFREGIRIAVMTNAKLLLFENVPGITSKRISKDSSKLIIDVLKEELCCAGYGNFIEVVLNAQDFGVPQNRKRFFVLACRFPKWKLSAPIPGELKPATVNDALMGLPNVIPNSDEERHDYTSEESHYSMLLKDTTFWKTESRLAGMTGHMPMRHRPCTLKRFSLLRQGESLKNLFERFSGAEREKLQAERVIPKKLFIKRNYRLRLNTVSPTVTSHCLDEFVHPLYDRALTVRECARLQSFPDSYVFAGGPYIIPHIDRSVQDKYEQIGDAVPPLLAYAWGREIQKIIEENS